MILPLHGESCQYCRWFNLRSWSLIHIQRMVEIWYQFPCCKYLSKWQLVVFTHFHRFSFCILPKFLNVQFRNHWGWGSWTQIFTNKAYYNSLVWLRMEWCWLGGLGWQSWNYARSRLPDIVFIESVLIEHRGCEHLLFLFVGSPSLQHPRCFQLGLWCPLWNPSFIMSAQNLDSIACLPQLLYDEFFIFILSRAPLK